MDESARATNCRLLGGGGHPVSVPVVEGLLQRHGFGKRQARKMKSAGEHAERNAQFERISEHKAAFATGPPLLSMDSKKKELVGNFWRKGELWTKEVVKTLDHDFPSLASGVVIPHGLYDLRANLGYVSLGTSSDTSEFAVESMLGWWGEQGRALYPEAAEILLLCDGGGSNSARTYLFKQDLLRFTATTGLRVRVAHYPPYTSKWNPIEHRLFPHLTRACAGVVLTSVGLVRELMSGAKTATGLEVTVKILDKVYEKGRQVAEAVKEEIRYQAGQVREKARIVYDEKLPRWNYRVFPRYVNVGDVI